MFCAIAFFLVEGHPRQFSIFVIFCFSNRQEKKKVESYHSILKWNLIIIHLECIDKKTNGNLIVSLSFHLPIEKTKNYKNWTRMIFHQENMQLHDTRGTQNYPFVEHKI